jgi:radical SAM superfamily enzyme YgiQ (UPF0313 family)
MMKYLFIQLPVPVLVPQKNAGNHLLASSSLLLHLKFHNLFNDDFMVLPQEMCTRYGDTLLTNTIARINPDVVAFTCTVWNIERTLYLSRVLKNQLPDIKIWYGGPEIAQDSYFMKEPNPPFDLAVEGEGEGVFMALIQGHPPQKINRVHLPYKSDPDMSTSIPLLDNLESIHNPFINGYAQMESDGVVMAEALRGCKYGCTFCRYHTQIKQYAFQPYHNIQALFNWMKENRAKEFFLLDPSLEQRPDADTFLSFLSQVNSNDRIPIFTELRAEFVTPSFALRLKDAGIHLVETGLQTVNPNALSKVGRKFDKEAFQKGIYSLQKENIQIRTDVMLGLPGDSPEEFLKTLQFLEELGLQSQAQIFRTQVLPGTLLKKHAANYNIQYETKPPYQVLSTPTWPEDVLEKGISEAEQALGISCSPDDSPLLISMADREEHFLKKTFPDNNAVFFYGFNCQSERGMEHVVKETFNDAANTISVVFAINDHLQSIHVVNAISKLIEKNPFSAIVIALDITAQFPLNIFDTINAFLQTHRQTDYLSRLFPTTYSTSPDRRLMAILPLENSKTPYTTSWIDAIRECAEIIWQTRNLPFLDNEHLIEPEDFCLVNIHPDKLTNSKKEYFKRFSETNFADRILIPDLVLQWEYKNSFDKFLSI